MQFTSRFLSFCTDAPIIVMLWTYFGYFFQMKKQAYTRKYQVFSTKQKVMVIWVLIILIINSVVFFSNNIIEMLMLFSVFSERFYEI